jgi:hypothetical protein
MADCFEYVRERSELEHLSDDEIRDLIGFIQKNKSDPRAKVRVGKYVKEMVDGAAMHAREKAQHVLKISDLDKRFEIMVNKGDDATGFFVSTQSPQGLQFEGAKLNMHTQRLTTVKHLVSYLKQSMGREVRLFASGKFDLDITLTLEKLNKNLDVSDVDPRIVKIAKSLKDLNGHMIERLRNAGKNIKIRNDYLFRQTHDATKIGKITSEEWSKRIIDKLDHNETFGHGIKTTKEKLDILEKIYNDIITGEFQNNVGSIGGKRTLHFKDAANFFDYI